MVKPLYELTSNKKPYSWTPSHSETFEKIKKHIANSTLELKLLDPNQELILQTDASMTGMGAVLLQKQKDQEVIVGIWSKSFRNEQKKLAAVTKEILALKNALMHFHEHLRDTKFVIRTDSYPISQGMKQKEANLIKRWISEIHLYDFTVEWVNGSSNVLADMLSRAPLAEVPEQEDIPIMFTQTQKESLEEMIAKYHKENGHIGKQCIVQLLRNSGIKHRKLDEKVRKVLKSCKECLTFNPGKTIGNKTRSSTPHQPNVEWQIDHIVMPQTNSANYLLQIVDKFTKFVHLRPQKTKDMAETVENLNQIIATVGTPMMIVADNAFDNEKFNQFCQEHKIELKTSSPHWPKSHGVVEKSNDVVQNMLRKTLEGRTQDWPQKVYQVQRMMNNIISESTGQTAFWMQYGREDEKIQISENQENLEEAVRELIERHNRRTEKAFPIIAKTAETKRQKYNFSNDKKRKIIKPLTKDTQVFIKNHNRMSKLDSKFNGPYKVVNQDIYGKYILMDEKNNILGRHYHLEEIKLANEFETTNQEEKGYVKSIKDHRDENQQREYLTVFESGQEEWLKPQDFDSTVMIERYWKNIKKQNKKKKEKEKQEEVITRSGRKSKKKK